MKRYRAIYSTSPIGGYAEFSADDDAEAIIHATRYVWNGRVVLLEEVTGPRSVRPVEIPRF